MTVALIAVALVVGIYVLLAVFCAGSAYGYSKAERDVKEDEGKGETRNVR